MLSPSLESVESDNDSVLMFIDTGKKKKKIF